MNGGMTEETLSYEGFGVTRNHAGRWQAWDSTKQVFVGPSFRTESACADYLHTLMRKYREPIMRWVLTGRTA